MLVNLYSGAKKTARQCLLVVKVHKKIINDMEFEKLKWKINPFDNWHDDTEKIFMR